MSVKMLDELKINKVVSIERIDTDVVRVTEEGNGHNSYDLDPEDLQQLINELQAMYNDLAKHGDLS